MQRIPKYTAGMFKKKMPRFGSSSIKMPRMPKPPKPRVKKFAEGGGSTSSASKRADGCATKGKTRGKFT